MLTTTTASAQRPHSAASVVPSVISERELRKYESLHIVAALVCLLFVCVLFVCCFFVCLFVFTAICSDIFFCCCCVCVCVSLYTSRAEISVEGSLVFASWYCDRSTNGARNNLILMFDLCTVMHYHISFCCGVVCDIFCLISTCV